MTSNGTGSGKSQPRNPGAFLFTVSMEYHLSMPIIPS